jgi:glycosyltransferase involved in cell wall biosynthesis
MKVLHILNELKFSGGETMLASAGPYWSKNNIELHVLSTGLQCGAYSNVLRGAGYIVHHIPYERRWAFVKRISKLIRQHAFDVVHIHPERGYLLYAVAAWFAETPLKVKTVHHIFRYKGLLRLRALLMRHFCRLILKVTFVSNSLSGRANEYRLYRMRNRYVPNWFDSNRYCAAAVTEAKTSIGTIRADIGIQSDNEVMLISLGGNWEYKNFDKVIRAIGSLPDSSRFVYVHCGVDEKNELQELARNLGVRFVGKGITPNVIPYLVVSDLFMMPSREEGFGIAAVEAMAVGVPLCLSMVPALCDFKELSDDIYWCDPSVESIAAFLSKFQKMDPVTREHVSLSLMTVAGEFSMERGALGYLDIYREGLIAR